MHPVTQLTWKLKFTQKSLLDNVYNSFIYNHQKKEKQ